VVAYQQWSLSHVIREIQQGVLLNLSSNISLRGNTVEENYAFAADFLLSWLMAQSLRKMPCYLDDSVNKGSLI